MLVGFYSAASAMRTAELNQDLIATNLAHMNVPGYRRSGLTTSAFRDPFLQTQDSPGFGTIEESIASDFTPGPMVATERTLDVAIDGDGFFAVESPNGTLYTRNGSFHIGEGGTLVGTHGMPILGTGGPIQVPDDVSPSDIQITTDGTISANGENIGQLQLVAFNDNSQLEQFGTTLFSPNPEAQISNTEVSVVQGMREQSNVQPIDELVSMIVAMRYHEAAQRTLRSIDDTIQQNTDPRG